MDSAHHNKCYSTNSRIYCLLPIVSGNINFIVSYIVLEVSTCHLCPGQYIDHCSFTITVPLLSLFLYYHCSFIITVPILSLAVPIPSLLLHYHCSPLLSLTLYYHRSFTITDPLQGGALISSNSLTGLSSNTTTATVEDLPTADYHVFQVGIPTVSNHTCQNIIQSRGWDPSILRSPFSAAYL